MKRWFFVLSLLLAGSGCGVEYDYPPSSDYDPGPQYEYVTTYSEAYPYAVYLPRKRIWGYYKYLPPNYRSINGVYYPEGYRGRIYGPPPRTYVAPPRAYVAPAPAYRPAPVYQPAPAPVYRPTPAPVYRPVPAPAYRPAPIYRPAPGIPPHRP